MSDAGLDPRIARGMRAQLDLRRSRLAAGARPIGWKVGFGAPAGLQRLRIDRPLVGHLTDRSVIDDGATVDVAGWTGPVLEPEIAVTMASDLEAGAGDDAVDAAIGGLAAAIELADVDLTPTDPEPILAGNIFHRHVAFGPVDATRRSTDGITARVRRDGEEVAATDAPEALTGELRWVIRSTADVLAACGERLRAGDVVITGSVVPPLKIAPGERIDVELDPLGALSVRLRGRAA